MAPKITMTTSNSNSKGGDELSKAEETQLDATLANLPGEEKVEMLSRVETLYAKACEANKKRAQRFGTEYIAPNRYVILRDELKRERQNPAAIKEELRRLKEREIKYNINSNSNEGNLQGGADEDMDDFFLLGSSSQNQNKKQGNNLMLNGGIQPLKYKTEEERVHEEEKRKKRQERFHHLGDNTNLKDEVEDGHKMKDEKHQPPDSIFCSTKLNGKYLYQIDNYRSDFLLEDEYVKRVYNKIHLYAIDIREFLCIRTIDIMNLFHAYNPTYVEWLGNKSCNIEFNTAEEAENALQSLSVPAPSTRQMLREMNETYEYAKKMKLERKRLAKLSKQRQKNKGRITTQAQLDEMMGGLDSNREGNDSEIQKEKEVEIEDDDNDHDEAEEIELESEDDFRNLALYGWHIGVSPIIKIYTDEYGTKGTAVRVLLRYATSNDVYKKNSEKRKRKYKYKKNLIIDDPEMYKKLFQIGEEDMMQEQQEQLGTMSSVTDGGQNGENNGKEILVEEGVEVNAQGLMEGESKPKRQKTAPVISPMSSKRVAGNMKLFGSVISRVSKDKESGAYKNRSLKKKENLTTDSETIIEETGDENEGKNETEFENGGQGGCG